MFVSRNALVLGFLRAPKGEGGEGGGEGKGGEGGEGGEKPLTTKDVAESVNAAITSHSKRQEKTNGEAISKAIEGLKLGELIDGAVKKHLPVPDAGAGGKKPEESTQV